MKSELHPKDGQLLSDFLDGQLSSQEADRLQKRLNEDENLRETLEDLRQLKIVLRNAPRFSVPHNFTLTPAMVGKKRFEILLPVLRFSSATAVFLLIASYLLELLPGVNPAFRTNAIPMAGAPIAEAPAAANIVEATPPPIILWNEGGQPGFQADGRGGAGGGPVTMEAQPSEKQMEPMVLPTTSDAAQPELAAPPPSPLAPQGGGELLPAAPDQNQNPEIAPKLPLELTTPVTPEQSQNLEIAPALPFEMATPEVSPLSDSTEAKETPMIFGIRPTDERAMILSPEANAQEPRTPEELPISSPAETGDRENNFWMWVKLVLAAVALFSGFGVILLQRKMKK